MPANSRWDLIQGLKGERYNLRLTWILGVLNISMEHRWKIQTGGKKRSTGGKACHSAIFSTTDLTWISPIYFGFRAQCFGTMLLRTITTNYYFNYNNYFTNTKIGRSQWPRGLRCRSAACSLCWDRGFESHRGHGCLSVVSVVCCQVEVSATSWSLVQRSPTECGALLCVIFKPQEWAGHEPSLVAAPHQKKIKRKLALCCWILYFSSVNFVYVLLVL